jgi:hypothetical protein
MHLVEDYIREMAQEEAKGTNEAHAHLKQCGECGNLFRMFVLHRFYTERPRQKRSSNVIPFNKSFQLRHTNADRSTTSVTYGVGHISVARKRAN